MMGKGFAWEGKTGRNANVGQPQYPVMREAPFVYQLFEIFV